MATTIITDGNVYIFIGKVNENTITHGSNAVVKIHATKIDYSYDNPLTIIPIFVSKGNRGANKVKTRNWCWTCFSWFSSK